MIRIYSFDISYGAHMPGGDLKKTYGFNSTIGGGFSYKTEGNWIYSVEGNYIFGRDVKIYDELFENITTSDGYIIDEGGIYTDMAVLEAGIIANAYIGKLIPVWGPNPNSGIIIKLGGGYMYHKIRLEQTENSAPQLSDDYIKGYDRFRQGFNFSQFIGYQYTGNNNLANFYFGFEFNQGWSYAVRAYNFDQMAKPDKTHFDAMSGFKVGWVIPLIKDHSSDVYTY
ncbi:MAG: hypothetical protein U9R32_03415 [Bacteroidota bacterium]|nr:hypothetical protein [Bacteroidota bacterium]